MTCLSFMSAVLLLILVCQCGKEFKHTTFMVEDGNQTLINYNQEAGMSECKVCRGLSRSTALAALPDPCFFHAFTPQIKPTQLTKVKTSTSVTDGVKKYSVQVLLWSSTPHPFRLQNSGRVSIRNLTDNLLKTARSVIIHINPSWEK